MELTQEEINVLGTDKNVFESRTNLKIIAESRSSFFDCMTYTFTIQNGYKRHIPLSGPHIKTAIEYDEIKKYEQGNGFFPTYAGKEAIFKFISGWYRKDHVEHLLKELGNYLNADWVDTITLKISIKDPVNYLIMFDFLPHNMGPYISIITRK